MFQLDVRSVILIAGIMSLLMAVVLFFLRRNYPPTIKGLTEWAAAPPILFVAALLFGTRGVLHDFFSIVLANLMLLVGAALLYFGSQRFFGGKPAIKLWSGLIVLTLGLIAWFAVVAPHYGMRTAIVSSFMSLLSFAHARLILARGPRTFPTYFAASALSLLTVTQAMRFLSAFDLSARDQIFDNNLPVQTAFVAVYAFAILVATIGMVLMATDRLRGELEHLASHDSLTGALSRRALIEACERELERCQRKNHVMSLLMIDLDHFKVINDSHGHLVGDRVLVDFVARVTAVLRRPDRFGRFGGEEFVALLPETSVEDARIVAERIRADIASADAPPWYTVSIGAATSFADDATVDSLLARADDALYQAKAAGRNRVQTAAWQ